MAKPEDSLDPKVEKRRQRNKVASANCRERKLKRAQLLQQQVSQMKSQVEKRKEAIQKLKKQIEVQKNYLTEHMDLLTDDERKKLQELKEQTEIALSTSLGTPANKEKQLLHSQDAQDINVEKPSTVPKKIASPIIDSGSPDSSDSSDDDYNPTNDDYYPLEKEDNSRYSRKRKYTKREYLIP